MNKILRDNKKWMIIGMIFPLLISCNLFPCGWATDLDKIDKKPTSEFLIGKYKLDERTLNFIPGYENAENAELHLEKNGSLILNNTPIGTFDFMDYYDETEQNVNAIGNWKVRKGKYTAKLSVNLNFEKEFSELDISTSWKIYEKDGKPVIFIILGDPDSCAAARFIKIDK